ncbi:MAG: hypothetical protein GY938_16625 [Ketobacter sp.]|nr:hypothetical protein [Ketobacter sp.]
MAKTHSRWATFTYNSQVLTCDITSASNVGIPYEKIDIVTLCNAMMESIAGRGNVSMGVAALFNNAPNMSHKVIEPLNGDNTGATLVIEIGSGAAPTTGDANFTVTNCCVFDYQVSVPGGIVTSSWTWILGEGATAAWGTVA